MNELILSQFDSERSKAVTVKVRLSAIDECVGFVGREERRQELHNARIGVHLLGTEGGRSRASGEGEGVRFAEMAAFECEATADPSASFADARLRSG